MLGCFNFYVNIYGLNNQEISKDELSIISDVFGYGSIVGALAILNIIRNARKKFIKLHQSVKGIEDGKWQ